MKPDLSHDLKIEEVKVRLLKLWKRHPLNFLRGWDLIENRPLLYTQDEHDEQNPVKPFPLTPASVAYATAWFDLHEQVLMIEKSRQIMATWTGIMLHLWYALFVPMRSIYFVGKHKHHTAKMVRRVKFVYQNLPEWVKTALPTSKPVNELPEYLFRLAHGSFIEGLPRGPEQLREATASAVFADEAAFIPHFEDVYAAAIPALAGGGKFTIQTSPLAGTFAEQLAEHQENLSAYQQARLESHAERIKTRLKEVEATGCMSLRG